MFGGLNTPTLSWHNIHQKLFDIGEKSTAPSKKFKILLKT